VCSVAVLCGELLQSGGVINITKNQCLMPIYAYNSL